MAEAMGTALLSQFLKDPEMKPYEDVLRTWMRKIWAEANIDQQFVRLYMDNFSEDELRQISAFYKTPVGQKSLQKLPELMQQGAAIGQQVAEAHLPELREAIITRRKELEAQEKKEQP